nr:unnamed protein product [Digitaria exilis]
MRADHVAAAADPGRPLRLRAHRLHGKPGTIAAVAFAFDKGYMHAFATAFYPETLGIANLVDDTDAGLASLQEPMTTITRGYAFARPLPN